MADTPTLDATMSRARGEDLVQVEVRQDTPKEIVDILDAVSQSRRITRGRLVNEILGSWAKKKVHEWTLIQRVTGGNPTAPDLPGSETE